MSYVFLCNSSVTLKSSRRFFPNSYPVCRNHPIWHHCAPYLFRIEKMIPLNASNKIWHSVNRRSARSLPNEVFSEPKKIARKGAILIILVEGLFIIMHLFGFVLLFCRFSWLLPQKQVYIGPSDFNRVFICKVRLMHCKRVLYCIWKKFLGYCYILGLFWCLIFLFIHLHPA